MENKKLIWLCVDSNGDEKLSNNPEGWQRFSPSKFHMGDKKETQKVISYNDIKMEYDHWIEYHNENDEAATSGILPHWMYLPKGTIKKIIGKELSWDNEPVKIEEEQNDNDYLEFVKAKENWLNTEYKEAVKHLKYIE